MVARGSRGRVMGRLMNWFLIGIVATLFLVGQVIPTIMSLDLSRGEDIRLLLKLTGVVLAFGGAYLLLERYGPSGGL